MNILDIIITIVLILIILAVHELAHGWMAWQFGDPTAKYAGRLTLNPISHFDPIGTTCVAICVFLGWPAMGSGKPVPVSKDSLEKPDIQYPIVKLAGPVSNFIMAFIGAILFQILGRMPLMNLICLRFIQINLSLGLFNLIPIPPLDGFQIFMGLISPKTANNVEDKIALNPTLSYVGIAVSILIAPYLIMTPYRFLYGLLVG